MYLSPRCTPSLLLRLAPPEKLSLCAMSSGWEETTRRLQRLGEAHNASGRGRLRDVRQVHAFYAGRRLAEEFHIPGPLPDLPPSYNVAPNGEVAAIVAGCGGERRLELLR